MGQSAHPGCARGRGGPVRLAAVLAAAAVAGSLTGCAVDVAAAPTSLAGVVSAVVVRADGSQLTAVDGLRLHRGDVVRTGTGGRVELRTRGRVVYVGSSAAVRVIDGAHQELRHGAVVVNALHGPALGLSLADVDVDATAGSAVRAERAATLRVGVLAGRAGIDSPAGRHLDVPALGQAVVGGNALPDAATPLRLTDDAGESATVPDLVRDDLALVAAATGIDTAGRGAAKAVTASWHGRRDADAAGLRSSERVLPILLADTARTPNERAD